MTKRPHDDEEAGGEGRDRAPTAGSSSKKARHSFRVAPENLPDGPWRRKLIKDKKEHFHRSKIEKQYAKIKARSQREVEATANEKFAAAIRQATDSSRRHHPHPHQEEEDDAGDKTSDSSGAAPPQIHPARQALLDRVNSNDASAINSNSRDGESSETQPQPRQQHQHQRRRLRPGYFEKDMAAAEKKKEAAAARAEEARRREEERARKTAERKRMRKAMARAKRPARGRNGEVGPRRLGLESGVLLEKVKKLMGDGGK